MPTFRQKGRGYNQKPYSGFLKTNDPENGAKGAEFNSYEELLNSMKYKKGLKKKKKQTYSYWTTTSDYPGGPERKIVQYTTTGEV
tara:strand:- start:8 stop:262 length:255 start_codon:yes stop_codon:yes gene_type:complete